MLFNVSLVHVFSLMEPFERGRTCSVGFDSAIALHYPKSLYSTLFARFEVPCIQFTLVHIVRADLSVVLKTMCDKMKFRALLRVGCVATVKDDAILVPSYLCSLRREQRTRFQCVVLYELQEQTTYNNTRKQCLINHHPVTIFFTNTKKII
ncbi:hypothetical protein ALC56_01229 [Trachymyrmex septentrionalis]|uniref:Uncharacterized protein n=1 Tax=Trachymyrmex septentrionalis TaxID=34720 RepID=A0A151K0Z7_9HYME|nr:hypothetical protein ALC56_01229 [Trachymyrmex septentrionalis]